jgi:hypothetical protein
MLGSIAIHQPQGVGWVDNASTGDIDEYRGTNYQGVNPLQNTRG